MTAPVLSPALPIVPPVAGRPPLHRALLTAALAVALVSLAVALVGLVVDPRSIGGAPAWLKPAKFGVSTALYLVALRWMLGVVRGHRRLLTAIAAVLLVGLSFELVAIALQVVRGTTSHFNTGSAFDVALYGSMGGVISTVLLATAVGAVLVLRAPGVDRTIAAGMRWGLLVTLLGMTEAVLMTVNFGWSDGGGHTVGGVDGGPGLPITGWSTEHGDLRIGHFVGLHALQVLPILAFLLLRVPGLGARTRTRLLTVAGAAYGGVLVLVTAQALRGQPLLAPDGWTLAAAAVLLAGVGTAAAAVLRRGA
ncbi:hypothetical protein [Amnibacterium setariae]|uniref:Uncharacterized protein n=1 Tax=Amnibacterium setariae TaxID=2306585 RepID=A0A3A1TUI8_9MICO|nr:hypothetical protein [Amnibacterium setariae]RIX27892.1 hypothetical protein D1781_10200 [Amnibacterium setariae]